MAIFVVPLHQNFVGEVSGVDLCSPLENDTFSEISDALDRYAVLVFRNQQLTDEQQIAFSKHFGPQETAIGTIRKKDSETPVGQQHSRRCLEPGREQQHPFDVRPVAHVHAGKPTLAYRQFLQARARARFPRSRRMKYRFPEAKLNSPIFAQLTTPSMWRPRNGSKASSPSTRSSYSRSLIGYTEFSNEERAALPAVPHTIVPYPIREADERHSI